MLDHLTGLEYLSVHGIGLKTFAGLPPLPRLRVIKASDNRITGQGLAALAQQGALEQLDLSGNRISSMEDLQPLASCANLKSMDFEGCPIATAGYEVR